jgi:uncharacterized protein
MGPKSFEQCAGFLKIPQSAEVLDNTWVHPENYPVAREIHEAMTTTTAAFTLDTGLINMLKEKHGAGEATIRDIAEELRKPNRDPRDSYPGPIMRKGVVTFEDLSVGMMITGKIKNVVDFGAFVDLGIKETALVHISEMSDRFIKDPLETVKAGDVMEFRIISLDAERRRIGLSRKNEQKPVLKQINKAAGANKKSTGASAEKQKKPGPRQAGPAKAQPPSVSSKKPVFKENIVDKKSEKLFYNSDSTMYNPFAEAFKKARERK